MPTGTIGVALTADGIWPNVRGATYTPCGNARFKRFAGVERPAVCVCPLSETGLAVSLTIAVTTFSEGEDPY
jgi:hypothetical protein